ncbi:hypothetical protein [Streptomyces sp. NPDC096142]|uniref:hypothetical protein n=1 Tax=Streptomyces sp. NPDC096142 TaxID=3366077 RepID=UPI00381F10BE
MLNGLAGAFVWALTNDTLAHGQDVADLGLLRFCVFAAFTASAVLVVSGVFAGKRFRWVPVGVLVVECVIAVCSLINVLVAGAPAAGVGLVVAVLIAKTLLDAEPREWFNH